ncbi:MAG: hypothetical protein EA424_04845 [Planctomycetaceae bacterium]|nr:MAG: hypothetical protein EA424_04845 [Planctomycetaceae bacterium]
MESGSPENDSRPPFPLTKKYLAGCLRFALGDVDAQTISRGLEGRAAEFWKFFLLTEFWQIPLREGRVSEFWQIPLRGFKE